MQPVRLAHGLAQRLVALPGRPMSAVRVRMPEMRKVWGSRHYRLQQHTAESLRQTGMAFTTPTSVCSPMQTRAARRRDRQGKHGRAGCTQRITAAQRVYDRSPRGRWRPVRDVLALVDGLACAECLVSVTDSDDYFDRRRRELRVQAAISAAVENVT